MLSPRAQVYPDQNVSSIDSDLDNTHCLGKTVNPDIPLDPIRVIDFCKYRSRKSFPRYPDNKEICENLDHIDFSKSFLIFISHCWLRGSEDCEGYDKRPHPDNVKNKKFQLSVEAIDKIWGTLAPEMEKCYIWLDYGCINQDGDPAGELKQLDRIVQMSDCMLTIIHDPGWKTWKYGNSMDGHLVDYKANAWIEGYLKRAWCRIEMLYAANIPLADDRSGQRVKKFRAGAKSAIKAGRRPHFLYGTKEKKAMLSPKPLSPLQHSYLSTYNPANGLLSKESDRIKIIELMENLKIYLKDPYQYGYFGRRNHLEQAHGRGKLLLPNGFIYDGEWHHGIPHGISEIIWPDGDVYIGSIHEGHITGQGYCYRAGGDIQQGIWVDGIQHGPGSFSYQSGATYEGNFVHGQITGQGRFTLSDGTVLFKGTWNNGMPRVSDRHFPYYLSKYICLLAYNTCTISNTLFCRKYDPVKHQREIEWKVTVNSFLALCSAGKMKLLPRKNGLVSRNLLDITDLKNHVPALQQSKKVEHISPRSNFSSNHATYSLPLPVSKRTTVTTIPIPMRVESLNEIQDLITPTEKYFNSVEMAKLLTDNVDNNTNNNNTANNNDNDNDIKPMPTTIGSSRQYDYEIPYTPNRHGYEYEQSIYSETDQLYSNIFTQISSKSSVNMEYPLIVLTNLRPLLLNYIGVTSDNMGAILKLLVIEHQVGLPLMEHLPCSSSRG
eukprot:gene7205-14693_t